jgi:N-hydroxyarylamine O-acetyltransferase
VGLDRLADDEPAPIVALGHTEPMDRADVDAYLARIGAVRPAEPSVDALRTLQVAHLCSVPFENLSIHLGEPVVLDESALFDKIVGRRRGGFCYEANGLFAALLGALGFEVTLLAARVFAPGGLGPPFDHLALFVHSAEPRLADVGFGDHALHPLSAGDRSAQRDPAGIFAVLDAADGDLDVSRDGQPQYRAESRGRALADFEPACWWHQTSPKSHFTRSLTCSLPTARGRVTLSDRRLIVTTDGRRSETSIADDEALLDAYRDHFGIVLDRLPSNPLAGGEKRGHNS